LRCLIVNQEVPPDAEEALKQAAIDAVLQWKFVPTTVKGQPTKVVGTITLNFHL
jgi:outer membrane biosynthesis protein TonB